MKRDFWAGPTTPLPPNSPLKWSSVLRDAPSGLLGTNEFPIFPFEEARSTVSKPVLSHVEGDCPRFSTALELSAVSDQLSTLGPFGRYSPADDPTDADC